MAAKGIVKGIITAAVICGLAAGGWGLYRHFGGQVSHSSEKVFVQKVATLNTVDGANLFAHDFAGVIVAQKTVDVKYDTQQTVDEILVKDGDEVKKGDKLLTSRVKWHGGIPSSDNPDQRSPETAAGSPEGGKKRP